MIKYLVTGCNGFIGKNFINFVKKTRKDVEIFGFGLDPGSYASEIEYTPVELTDFDKTKERVREIKPDYIFHFAGVHSSDDLEKLMDGNVKTTISILEAAKNLYNTKILVVGSAAEYGKPKELPVKETHELRPISNYGASMVRRSEVALMFAEEGVNVSIGRLFNPIGYGLGEKLALGAFAKQIEGIESGIQKEIVVRDLSAKRDFIDIDDANKAFLAIAEKGNRGEAYNVCSGEAHTLREILDLMLKERAVQANIVEKGEKSVIPEIYGSIEKIREHTDWKPRIAIQESIKKLF